MQLKNVPAVVTGGASGLGKAVAQALAYAGAKVAIFDANEDLGAKVAQEIGGIFCHVDVSDDSSVEHGFARARAMQGQERVLVNCAGTGKSMRTVSRTRETGEIRQFPIESFIRTVNVNLVGTFRCLTHSAAGMLALDLSQDEERGVIVNTASVAAEDGQPGQASYSASKGGIVAMTLTIARDLARESIRVNTISPGIFSTPPMLSVPASVRTNLKRSVPFPKRMGVPEEFASLVLEICRNTYINAAHIRLDGGIRMGFTE